MTLADKTAPDESPTERPAWRRCLDERLAAARARARAEIVGRTLDLGRWLHALPVRTWLGLGVLDLWLVWALWTIDRSAPGRIAEGLGAVDRGAWRRLLAIPYSSAWDRPLVRLYRFSPNVIAVIGALVWLIGLPAVYGINPVTTTLVSPALGFLGLVVASQEYGKTARGRTRGGLGADGWATYNDLHRAMTAHRVRMEAVRLRPSLEDRTRGAWTDRPAARFIAQLPVSECGTWLGRTAVGPTFGIDLYCAHRFVIGAVAAPQTAKTAWLGHGVLGHPGAVLSTSTKADVYEHTAALRALFSHSGEVEIFNPEGLGGYDSTFAWSPLIGCDRAGVAAERAGAMVGATSAAGGDDGQFWLDSAAKVLRCLLLAAALDEGRTMLDVASWISSSQIAFDALDILQSTRYRSRVPAGWALEMAQVLSTEATKTRESIFLTLAQSVAFMSDPDVAALCIPGADEPVFDVEAFIRDRGTLYLIGSERPHQTIAPLLAALTTHVFEEAKRLASRQPKGRLDPPLLLALDEVALITPIPLDRWTADAGGRGIHIIWTAQSPSQLAQRWGERGRQTIWNNTNVKLVFGGLTLVDDLADLERLCGTVEVPGGESGPRRRELASIDAIRELPEWHAVCIHRNTRPTVIRIYPVWERRDVRHAPLYTPSPARDRIRRGPRLAVDHLIEETAA